MPTAREDIRAGSLVGSLNGDVKLYRQLVSMKFVNATGLPRFSNQLFEKGVFAGRVIKLYPVHPSSCFRVWVLPQLAILARGDRSRDQRFLWIPYIRVRSSDRSIALIMDSSHLKGSRIR